MLKNNFYCNPTIHATTNVIYYVRLVNSSKPLIKFSQFKNTLELTFTFDLEGLFNLPENLLLMNIDSNIGQFNNIKLRLIKDYKVKKRYEANLLINLNSSAYLSSDHFLEELYFKVNFDINETVLNNSNISGNFNTFYRELKNITMKENVFFNNYFPISKLSEYYISSSYKNNFYNLDSLPYDLFSWSNKLMTINSEYWFIKAQDFSNIDHKTSIDKLYYANVKDSSFIKTFDKVSIILNYFIEGKQKSLKLDLESKPNNNINQNKTLFLGINTIYNFEKQELYQSTEGIQGIYFPIKTSGYLDVLLTKNNINYRDKINFNFANNFYSTENTSLQIELSTFSDVSGKWNEIIYA